ncbi:MAG: hypothetical protein GEU78_04240 [Actinobacteria bacterium]|nr:hypothetical protein [Actinomycetota bacterium]
MERPDAMIEDSDLPQPGTDEPERKAPSEDEETDGPGNVTVDEPTAPALAPEEIEQESSG